VLPPRYQSLRLFGLGKSVVVDEIHTYDGYVRELIAALLEFHASQGGSAILLFGVFPAHAGMNPNYRMVEPTSRLHRRLREFRVELKWNQPLWSQRSTSPCCSR
jgi:hypothetical protein